MRQSPLGAPHLVIRETWQLLRFLTKINHCLRVSSPMGRWRILFTGMLISLMPAWYPIQAQGLWQHSQDGHWLDRWQGPPQLGAPCLRDSIPWGRARWKILRTTMWCLVLWNQPKWILTAEAQWYHPSCLTHLCLERLKLLRSSGAFRTLRSLVSLQPLRPLTFPRLRGADSELSITLGYQISKKQGNGSHRKSQIFLPKA